jgi:hypothetical protein
MGSRGNRACSEKRGLSQKFCLGPVLRIQQSAWYNGYSSQQRSRLFNRSGGLLVIEIFTSGTILGGNTASDQQNITFAVKIVASEYALVKQIWE